MCQIIASLGAIPRVSRIVRCAAHWEGENFLMFGDDPKNRSAVAKSFVKCAASTIDWLEQAYRLKRLADELIEGWLLANRLAGVGQMHLSDRYPPIETSELN